MPAHKLADESVSLGMRITVIKRELDSAREMDDTLRAALLEEALNDLLERYTNRSACNR